MKTFLISLSFLFSLFLLLFFPFEKVPPANKNAVLSFERGGVTQGSFRRQAKEITLRVRNTGCSGRIGTGSGFALDEKTVVTNRHVLQGATSISLNTWDGRSLAVNKENALLAKNTDLAFIYLEEKLPVKSEINQKAKRGEEVVAVGYPGGGILRLSSGRIREIFPGRLLLRSNYRGKIIATSAKVRKGNSGGPLLNSQGQVIAIVFAAEQKRERLGESYAIPVSQALSLAQKKEGVAIKSSC